MSSESRASTRRGRSRARRSRGFLLGFVVVAVVLAVIGGTGAAVAVARGPRVTHTQVDPAAAIQGSGARLIFTASQSLAKVTPDQVKVTPDAPFTIDTAGRTVGVRFSVPLRDSTSYTVTISGVTGVGGGAASVLAHTFHTPKEEFFLLQRGQDGDTVFRSDLAGDAAVPVFHHPHIEDFRAAASHLVFSVRTADDTAALIVTNLDGSGQRELTVPGKGNISNLRTSDRGQLIGYTYSDADPSAPGGKESRLYTASLRDAAADDDPTPVEVAGADPRVLEWSFVPGTDRILLLSFDSSLLLTDAAAKDVTSLGTAMSIRGITPGSPKAIVTRPESLDVIDLSDASDTPLVAPKTPLGPTADVVPMPDGGTLRTTAVIGDRGLPTATQISVVGPDGTTTSVRIIDHADAVLQTCVSPNGRYAALMVAPDAVDNRYDTYQLPMPGKVETRIVDLEDGTPVVSLAGFAISWCENPPR